ncbi:MAG: IclR family transcriptional regulator [Verrucomicrobiota bacterium]
MLVKEPFCLNESAQSPGTDRTLAILELLSEHSLGLSVAQMVRHLGISQNSAFRITHTLLQRGYLHRRESDKCFVLSNKLFDLSRPKINEKSLVVCAYEAMQALRDSEGETVQLLVRSADKAVVLEQVGGTHPVKVTGEVGLRVPLFSCAPGKAMLAWLPDDEFADWLGGVKLKSYTATTLSTRKALKEDLTETRKRGYAIDLAEGLEGIHCIGVPILNQYEYPVAALTVMSPSFRLPESEFERLGLECIRAAAAIQQRLFE